MTNFLGMRETEKTALFIDGANLYKAARALGFDMDYKSLLAKARSSSQLIRAYYYTAIQEDKEQDYSPLRPLVDWLDYNGYTMVTKMAREFTDATGKKRFKGSTDIELAVDMVNLAERLDHIILFSGNGDFKRAIDVIQSKGLRVSVVSTIKSQPPMASDELRRQADRFFDLADLEKEIGRTGAPPRKPRQNQSDDYDDEYENDFDDEFEDVE
ncbi:MAG TPA: NYN domain-containing protein [Parvularculaceae bacterium]|nr:NYN domain-containing protein [Parvularculaceae bacterium]HNS87967.1 NYN domain-containing protein [Parvularculaceae bacterium]